MKRSFTHFLLHTLKFKKMNRLYMFFLIILFFGCSNRNQLKEYTDEISTLDKMIIIDTSIFIRCDSLNYKNNTYYQKVQKIEKLLNSILNSVTLNKINKDSVSIFNNYIKEVISPNSYYNPIRESDLNQDSRLKLKILESYIIKDLCDRYRNEYYMFQWVKPIVVPRKTNLNVGDEYIADIYMAGIDKNNKFKVNIDNYECKTDTLNPFVPIFKEKILNKSSKMIKGYILFNQPFMGKLKYDISAEINMKP